MEMYESVSRALMRRKYRRLAEGASSSSTTGFVVQPKRVKVAQLAAVSGRRRRGHTTRLRLRCFRLRFLAPGRFMAIMKATAVKLMQLGMKSTKCTSRSSIAVAASHSPKQLPQPIQLLPSNQPLRSSSNDVIDEEWFQNALRRSIAEGRLPI